MPEPSGKGNAKMQKEKREWEKGAAFVLLSAPQPSRKPGTTRSPSAPGGGIDPGADQPVLSRRCSVPP